MGVSGARAVGRIWWVVENRGEGGELPSPGVRRAALHSRVKGRAE